MEFELMEKALTEAEKYNVSLAEVRVFALTNETLSVRNGQIDQAGKNFDSGINVSIIKDGARGFAMSSRKDNIAQVVEQAVKIAHASAKKKRKPIELTDEPVIQDNYITEHKIDPFAVDFEEKLELLKLSDSIMRENPQIRVAESELDYRRVKLYFANSEGARISQEQLYTGTAVQATAVGKADAQRRDHHDYQMRGFEMTKDFDFETTAKRVADEALLLVNQAVNPENEKVTFVLDPYMLGLTIHESTGHPSELDRAMGFEADFAGTSFLTPDLLGKGFKYGSDLVNLVCDPTIPENLGHYKYDDEGVAAKRFNVVENGIFKNYMTDRETAKDVGYEHSFGNSRMSLYNRIPIVRMSHLYLEPDKSGPKNFDEFLADIPNGIYASGWKSHSIDDKRMNFQFSTQIAWKIENGELTTPLKNLTYNAQTPEFWGSVDMIGRENHINGHGPVCGKGVPMQAIWISHGGGWTRFNNVNTFAG